MSFTKIQLASRASTLLGGAKIQAGEETVYQLWVDEHFDALLEHSLLLYPWSFALKSENLTLESGAKTKKYRFRKPANLLRILSAYNDSNLIEHYWEDSQALECDFDQLTIQGIFKVAEEDLPSYFSHYFVYFLAQHMAISFTDQLEKAGYFQQIAEIELQKACLLDQTNYQKDTRSLNLLNFSRYL